MNNLLFVHPHTLLNQVEKVLTEVGPEMFFKSPEERIKKAREGFAAYFFMLTMKKYTGRDWWLLQPDQAERSYPDFDFMAFGKTSADLSIESVELTGVYPHFKSFDEVVNIVENKIKKYGNNPVKFSLLIFVNHEKSEEWISQLKDYLIVKSPFVSVWTIHLLYKPGGQEIASAVAEKIIPLPNLRVVANMNDPEIHQRQPLPNYIEQKRAEDGSDYIFFKQEFIDEIKNSGQS